MPVNAYAAPDDPLVARSHLTCTEISRVASLLAYIFSAQYPTVAPPPASAGHSDTPLLQEYASHGFPMEVGPEWSLPTIHKAIATGPHTSTLISTATAFFQTDILEHSIRGFSIVLAEENAIRLFRTLLRIS